MTEDKKDIGVFIPRKITIGRFSYKGRKRDYLSSKSEYITYPISDSAIITCKFRSGSWLQSGAFERLTGYKPTNQTDKAAQLAKQVMNIVEEIENVPVSGFKIESSNEDIYERRYYPDEVGDVAIRDPRGFVFPLSVCSFFKILSENGGNITGNVLNGSFVYGWTDDKKDLTLIKAGESGIVYSEKPHCEKRIRSNQLELGKAYKATRLLDGIYVYLGQHDTYSMQCHLNALTKGRYDVPTFIESDKLCLRSRFGHFPTTTGKMIFYKIGAKPNEDPYVIRSSADDIFSEETEIPSGSLMYNSFSVPVTYDNLLIDMERNVAFKRIDLSQSKAVKPVSFELFEEIFSVCRKKMTGISGEYPKISQQTRPLRFFPYGEYDSYRKTFFSSGNWYRFDATKSFNTTGVGPYCACWEIFSNKSYNQNFGRYFGHSILGNRRYETCENIWKKYSPCILDLKFDNGQSVSEEQAVHFAPY